MSKPEHATEPIAGPRLDLCLGFANTLSWRGGAAPAESLADFSALLQWLAGNAGWPAIAVAALREWSLAQPGAAAALFAEAIALREAIYHLFSAIAAGETVADADFAAFDRALAAAPGRNRLARRDRGFGWVPVLALPREREQEWQDAPSVPMLLAPVLWSAGDLAAAPAGAARVRRCANDECLWLFVDESRNGSRRWCDMRSCGNRAKARRHYLKVTATTTASRSQG